MSDRTFMDKLEEEAAELEAQAKRRNVVMMSSTVADILGQDLRRAAFQLRHFHEVGMPNE